MAYMVVKLLLNLYLLIVQNKIPAPASIEKFNDSVVYVVRVRLVICSNWKGFSGRLMKLVTCFSTQKSWALPWCDPWNTLQSHLRLSSTWKNAWNIYKVLQNVRQFINEIWLVRFCHSNIAKLFFVMDVGHQTVKQIFSKYSLLSTFLCIFCVGLIAILLLIVVRLKTGNLRRHIGPLR